jgi:hypothetical protein
MQVCTIFSAWVTQSLTTFKSFQNLNMSGYFEAFSIYHDKEFEILYVKGPAADATDIPQPWDFIVQPCEEDD